jgi:hypothetical protein
MTETGHFMSTFICRVVPKTLLLQFFSATDNRETDIKTQKKRHKISKNVKIPLSTTAKNTLKVNIGQGFMSYIKFKPLDFRAKRS